MALKKFWPNALRTDQNLIKLLPCKVDLSSLTILRQKKIKKTEYSKPGTRTHLATFIKEKLMYMEKRMERAFILTLGTISSLDISRMTVEMDPMLTTTEVVGELVHVKMTTTRGKKSLHI